MVRINSVLCLVWDNYGLGGCDLAHFEPSGTHMVGKYMLQFIHSITTGCISTMCGFGRLL